MPSSNKTDPRWPDLFSVMVHDVRTPITVVAGYVDMLLKERFGALSDKQRSILAEVQKSCGRVTALLKEGSELTSMERTNMAMNRQPSDLRALLRAAVEQVPPMPERDVRIELLTGSGDASFQADATRLTRAFAYLLFGLRREVVTSDRLLVHERRTPHGFEIRIGDEETLPLFDGASIDDLPVFDEWRGGVGVTLAIARRVLNAHDGRIAGASELKKTGALVVLRA
jgi:K+-sensing histidine kinase KdpD